MQTFTEEQIRAAVEVADAAESAELAFTALGTGAVTVPQPMGLPVREHDGELHVKSAHLHGSRFFVVKCATGFYRNPQHGLPSGSGLMLLFDATTGYPLALLQDNGYLTELRTAAAGALAAKLLAVKDFQRVAVIGAGTQARYQLRALAHAFRWPETRVWARRAEQAQQLCDELRSEISTSFIAAASVEDAVRGADVVLTVTPSKEPLVHGDWLEAHATVIAVGSDEPEKRELHESVFGRCDRVIVDSAAQCARLGELHHALEAGLSSAANCAELGEIVAGRVMGRMESELVICDLTGVGAQDAAIAEVAYRKLVSEPP